MPHFLQDPEGIRSVEVNADRLYQAVARAVFRIQAGQVRPRPAGPDAELTVAVFRPPVEHTIRLAQVAKWAKHTTKDGRAGLFLFSDNPG